MGECYFADKQITIAMVYKNTYNANNIQYDYYKLIRLPILLFVYYYMIYCNFYC